MALKDNLLCHYRLEESSGTRVDAHTGGHDLTDNNTTPGVTGQVGNGADCERDNSEWLGSSTAGPAVSNSNSLTMACWFNIETYVSTGGILCIGGVSGNVCLDFATRNAGRMRLYIAGSTNDFLELTSGPGSGWHYAVTWHDVTAQTINIQIDNGTPSSQSYTGTRNSVATGGGIALGAYNCNASYTLDGIVDEASFWDRVLTSDEKTWLYNSGSGRAWSEWDSGGSSILIPRVNRNTQTLIIR